jgi:hypothetical protein
MATRHFMSSGTPYRCQHHKLRDAVISTMSAFGLASEPTRTSEFVACWPAHPSLLYSFFVARLKQRTWRLPSIFNWHYHVS